MGGILCRFLCRMLIGIDSRRRGCYSSPSLTASLSPFTASRPYRASSAATNIPKHSRSRDGVVKYFTTPRRTASQKGSAVVITLTLPCGDVARRPLALHHKHSSLDSTTNIPHAHTRALPTPTAQRPDTAPQHRGRKRRGICLSVRY